MEYKDNETVTISLERYEELKQNQRRLLDLSPESAAAMIKYMNDNNLSFEYPSIEECPRVKVVKKEVYPSI